MKKYSMYVIIVLTLCLIGCAKTDTDGSKDAVVNQNGSVITDNQQNVDIDLTELSDIMAEAEINNMIMQPEKYLGKTVKIKGIYFISASNEGDVFHLVLIPDSTGCCFQGFEFIWSGDHSEFKEGDEIEVTGVYSEYETEDSIYSFIKADVVISN
jgi:hypothetical protein